MEVVEIFGKIKATTGAAILINDGTEETWIPLSQIRDVAYEYEVGEEVELKIPEWLAYKNGLI